MTWVHGNPVYRCRKNADHRFRSDTRHLVEREGMRFPPCPECGGELELENLMDGLAASVAGKPAPRFEPDLARLAQPEGYRAAYRNALADQVRDWRLQSAAAPAAANDESEAPEFDLGRAVVDTFAAWFCQCGSPNAPGTDRCRQCKGRRRDCEDEAQPREEQP